MLGADLEWNRVRLSLYYWIRKRYKIGKWACVYGSKGIRSLWAIKRLNISAGPIVMRAPNMEEIAGNYL